MKITIAIPTRERAEFLGACLRTVTAIADPDLEILVSDNASDDATRAVVAAAGDPRIVYVHTGQRVSQRQNFENAVRQASGDYVMLIGDDDAVLAGQWPRLRAVLAASRPAMLAWPAIFYHWPGPEKRAGGGRLKLLRARLYGDAFERSAEAHLGAICRLERAREDLSPKLYHGLVRRDVLESLRSRTGHYVGSGQVDAYFAAAALAVVPAYHYVRHPFTILAMGPQSGGTSVITQHDPASANETARRVADEAAADPLVEPLAMPFPVLGFYLLNGLEQANRLAFSGTLPLDYAAYFEMIGDQLEKVGTKARAQGLRLLGELASDLGRAGEFAPQIDRLAQRLSNLPEPRPGRMAGRQIGLMEKLSGLSLVEPSRIGIDLKPRGLAAVDGAARMADYLIGPPGPAHIAPADARRRWLGALSRAAGIIAGRRLA